MYFSPNLFILSLSSGGLFVNFFRAGFFKVGCDSFIVYNQKSSIAMTKDRINVLKQKQVRNNVLFYMYFEQNQVEYSQLQTEPVQNSINNSKTMSGVQ